MHCRLLISDHEVTLSNLLPPFHTVVDYSQKDREVCYRPLSSSAVAPSSLVELLIGRSSRCCRCCLSPCATCEILRRRSAEKCVLARYFPLIEPKKFTIAHRVFGASNIIKFLQL
uniref:LOB domain-containing protein n=1 Tax=Manihot esculenta TaxID=3983 RepID=A0A2C9WFD2_MANES